MRRKRKSGNDPYVLSKKLLSTNKVGKSATKPNIYTRTNTGFVVEEGFLDSLYQPHTLTALICFLVGVVYVPSQITAHPLQSGIVAGSSLFICYGAVQFRDGILMRPHPMVWRIVHAIGILYIVCLAFLLYQPVGDIRSTIIPMFAGTPGNFNLSKSYGGDCVMFRNGTMNTILKDTIFDLFVIAHGLGYFVHALLARNWVMLWVTSVMFEVLEASLQHVVPNFQECWWDHLLLDIWGFNLAGMVVGMWLVSKLAAGLFDWGGEPYRKLPSRRKKFKRIVWQLFPHKFERYQWSIFVDFRRFAIVMAVVFGQLLLILNAFLLKHIFWVPSSNPINSIRMALISAIGIPASQEAYEFSKPDREHLRLGQNAWILVLLLLLETVLIGKNIPPEMLQLPSSYITFCWCSSSLLFSCWIVFQYYVLPTHIYAWLRNQSVARARKLSQHCDRFSMCILFLSIVPLLYILARDCYRTYAFADNPAVLAPIGQGEW